MDGIRYSSIVKEYGGVRVLEGVSLEVKPGSIVALLGPNGSGKSTLLKMSVGLVAPDSGTVSMCGVNPVDDPVEARRRVGYLPEEPVLFESLRADEYVRFIAGVYGVQLDWGTVGEWARRLGLWEHGSKLVGELSHGNKRKLMLLTVIVRNPPCLVLDEVFSGLDPLSAVRVKAWMREAAALGRPVLFSTHILPIAEAIADRIAIIYKGRVVAQGTAHELEELYGAEGLEEVFLSVTGHEAEYRELLHVLRGGGDEDT